MAWGKEMCSAGIQPHARAGKLAAGAIWERIVGSLGEGPGQDRDEREWEGRIAVHAEILPFKAQHTP